MSSRYYWQGASEQDVQNMDEFQDWCANEDAEGREVPFVNEDSHLLVFVPEYAMDTYKDDDEPEDSDYDFFNSRGDFDSDNSDEPKED